MPAATTAPDRSLSIPSIIVTNYDDFQKEVNEAMEEVASGKEVSFTPEVPIAESQMTLAEGTIPVPEAKKLKTKKSFWKRMKSLFSSKKPETTNAVVM
jgi:hypothetical protein